MADIIQIRRDTAANWNGADPILAEGELGLETDTNNIKIGNGTGAWSSLTYAVTGFSGVTEDQSVVNFTGDLQSKGSSVVTESEAVVNFTGDLQSKGSSVVTDDTVATVSQQAAIAMALIFG